MTDFVVHPGAVEPYERLSLESLGSKPAPRAAATAYYRRLAAKAGLVLEYGAGRGALTWPLAEAGAKVTAVELSPILLGELEAAGTTLPPAVRRRVTRKQADMRSLRLPRRFPLVLAPLGTLGHLYNRRDLEAFLGGVRLHLAPGGRFVFDICLPSPNTLAHGYDPVSQVHLQELDGGLCLARRQYFPRELRMLLHYGGFTRVRLRVGFSPRASDREADVLVVSAERRESSRGRAAC